MKNLFIETSTLHSTELRHHFRSALSIGDAELPPMLSLSMPVGTETDANTGSN
eukprot:COSAG03_NODE_17393_length_376_cov_1.180505_2_plen_52_part_01